MAKPKTVRRPMDQYATPPSYTSVLLKQAIIRPSDSIFECCNGRGDIAEVLNPHVKAILTNDIDKKLDADTHLDMSLESSWEDFKTRPDRRFSWAVVTNPPYGKLAFPIVKNAVESGVRVVAVLCRLSFMEPTVERGEWLKANPPDEIIVVPRHSFSGDGRKDFSTCAWFIWYANDKMKANNIHFYTTEDKKRDQALPAP